MKRGSQGSRGLEPRAAGTCCTVSQGDKGAELALVLIGASLEQEAHLSHQSLVRNNGVLHLLWARSVSVLRKQHTNAVPSKSQAASTFYRVPDLTQEVRFFTFQPNGLR